MKMMTEHGNGLRGPWSRFGRVGRVKFGDDLGCVTEFGREHPGHLLISAFITSPAGQVQEVTVSSASVYLGVKDFGYFVLDVAVDFDWRRR